VTKKKAFAIGSLTVAALLVGYLSFSPVILRVPFFREPHTGQPEYVLLNPLRRRAPEDTANNILLSLKSGHCKETLQSALDMTDSEKAHMCEMINEFGLADWQLHNRTDTGNTCELYFHHQGDDGVWVTLRKVRHLVANSGASSNQRQLRL
jgi:hypothetical protein